MATDYSKLKNAELESLLKERSLPHTGKKAEMVARLTDHDKSTGAAPSIPTTNSKKSTSPSATKPDTPAAGATTIASSEPAAAAVAGGGATRADNPLAVPNQKPDEEDPTTTNDLIVTQDTTTSKSTTLSATDATAAASTDTAVEAKPAEAAPLFSANLTATDFDSELEKRKARAKKFGITETDDDAVKAVERARRFGTGTEGEKSAGAAVRGLDEALPERQKKRGRGGEEGQGDRGGKRRERGGGGAARPKGLKPEASDAPKQSKTGASWMTDEDRQKAEARKAKFG